jgi:microcystin-dependent protein
MLPPMTQPSMTSGQVPVGSLVAYAGASSMLAYMEQTGWMLCDGRTLEAAIYPELFATLGYSHGGEGGSFAIPDYRDIVGGPPSVSYLIKFTYGVSRMGASH